MEEDSYTEVTESSWGEKISGSITGMIVGVVLFIGSFPFLFWNEGRAVERYNTLKEGEGAVASVSSVEIDPDMEGRLVHVSGLADTEEILDDPEFEVSALSLKLARNVEMYQWKETKETKKRKKTGGGSSTTTTYKYSKTWSSSLIDSTSFKKSGSHRNPDAMPFQSREFMADEVNLGAFMLSKSLIRKINNREPFPVNASEPLPDALVEDGDFYGKGFYMGSDPTSPEIGDVRITFTIVRPSEVSLIARQDGDSFAAYRTEAGGAIELLELGAHDARKMFKTAHESNKFLTWIFRIGGSIAMCIGLFIILGPFSALADVLPFLGGIVRAGSFLIAFLATCVLSFVTIGAAWIFYRPILGITLLLLGAVLTAVVFKLGAKRKKSEAAPRPARMTGAPASPPPPSPREEAAPSPPPLSPPGAPSSPEDTMKPSRPTAPLPPQRPRTRPPSASPSTPPSDPSQRSAPFPPSAPSTPSLEDTLPPSAPAPPSQSSKEDDWMAKGKAHYAQRNFQEAMTAFTKAIEANPNSAAAYFDRGVVFTKLGANERAVKDLKAAARLNHQKAQKFLSSKNISW